MINYSLSLESTVQNILIKYPNLLNYIREDRYRISDTELTYRQINSLDQSDLTNDTRKTDKEWRKFNLNDLLYLHIISHTRQFNLGNSQLKYLKSLFYDTAPFSYAGVGDISFSEVAVVALLTEVIPVGVLLFSDGQGILTDDASISFSMGFADIKHRPFIYIMLHETFKAYIQKARRDEKFKNSFDLDSLSNDYSIKPISKKEKALLKIVKNGNYSEITIKKQQDGGLVVYAEGTSEGNGISEEDIMKLFSEKDHIVLKAQKRDGRVVSFSIKDTFKI